MIIYRIEIVNYKNIMIIWHKNIRYERNKWEYNRKLYAMIIKQQKKKKRNDIQNQDYMDLRWQIQHHSQC